MIRLGSWPGAIGRPGVRRSRYSGWCVVSSSAPEKIDASPSSIARSRPEETEGFRLDAHRAAVAAGEEAGESGNDVLTPTRDVAVFVFNLGIGG